LERDTVDVGVLRLEVAIVVERVGATSESAADDLLTEELAAECADAEDMGHGVGVPAFSEHQRR
jgi:hypothetical protein